MSEKIIEESPLKRSGTDIQNEVKNLLVIEKYRFFTPLRSVQNDKNDLFRVDSLKLSPKMQNILNMSIFLNIK
jgi:hypothetical protein